MPKHPTPSGTKRRAVFQVQFTWILVPVVAAAAILWNVQCGAPYTDVETLRARMRSAGAMTLLATSFAGFVYFSVRLFSRVIRGELFRLPHDASRRLDLRGELVPLIAILGTLLVLWIFLQLS